MAESFGVKGRGKFYDETGVIRDVIQNHLLQVVSYLAMEAPSSTYRRGDPRRAGQGAPQRAPHERRAHGARTVQRLPRRAGRREGLVHGDVRGARLYVDSWRWEGVPFYVRAGKSLAMTCTEVMVELKNPPQVVFKEPAPAMGNYIRFRVSPNVTIALGARAKLPGEKMIGKPTELSVVEEPEQGEAGRLGDYERLLGDAMMGDATLFARQDVVEAAWAIVDPVIHGPSPMYAVRARHVGPEGSRRSSPAEVGGWNTPK